CERRGSTDMGGRKAWGVDGGAWPANDPAQPLERPGMNASVNSPSASAGRSEPLGCESNTGGGISMDLPLRPGTLADAERCGTICYEAFKAIDDRHHSLQTFPRPRRPWLLR